MRTRGDDMGRDIVLRNVQMSADQRYAILTDALGYSGGDKDRVRLYHDSDSAYARSVCHRLTFFSRGKDNTQFRHTCLLYVAPLYVGIGTARVQACEVDRLEAKSLCATDRWWMTFLVYLTTANSEVICRFFFLFFSAYFGFFCGGAIFNPENVGWCAC